MAVAIQAAADEVSPGFIDCLDPAKSFRFSYSLLARTRHPHGHEAISPRLLSFLFLRNAAAMAMLRDGLSLEAAESTDRRVERLSSSGERDGNLVTSV